MQSEKHLALGCKVLGLNHSGDGLTIPRCKIGARVIMHK